MSVAATPGPWAVVPFTDEYGEQLVYVSMGDADSTVLRGGDAALIAKTPDMARLLIDMGEAGTCRRFTVSWCRDRPEIDEDDWCSWCKCAARLDTLGKDTA